MDNAPIPNFDIPEPTYKTVPTGGVINPIDKLITIMIPKYAISILYALNTGNKTGTKINTAGIKSITHPTSNKNSIIINIKIVGLSVNPLIVWTNSVGI